MHVTFIGMTHLGLVSAVSAAIKGHHVLCWDPNPLLISQLSQGTVSFIEPQLKESLKTYSHQIDFSCKPEALASSSLIYIAPDVPTNDLGESNLQPLCDLLDRVCTIAHPDAIIVIHSQVPPGFCRSIKWNHLYYHVETLIFGQAISRALYPERLIIGVRETEVSVPPLLVDYLKSYQCPILTMKFESAELAKISINLFLISSVTTTNTIARLCEKIGANWSEIAEALRLDKRIGPHAYLSPGLGISGGNLERDMNTFCQLAHQHAADHELIQLWQKLSKKYSLWALEQFKACAIPSSSLIACLGLSYKKNTSSVKNSPAIFLLQSLSDYHIKAYDPAVKNINCSHVQIEKSACQAIEGAEVLFIMTPWDEFSSLSTSQISKYMKGKWIIDPFGVLPKCVQKEFNYMKIGE